MYLLAEQRALSPSRLVLANLHAPLFGSTSQDLTGLQWQYDSLSSPAAVEDQRYASIGAVWPLFDGKRDVG